MPRTSQAKTRTSHNTGKTQRASCRSASGGIIFTTIQKFFPEGKSKDYPCLSERKNIIVIADEAHSSQYGFGLKVPKNLTKSTSNMATQNTCEMPCQTPRLSLSLEPLLSRLTVARLPFLANTSTSTMLNNPSKTAQLCEFIYESRLAKVELKPEERPSMMKSLRKSLRAKKSKAKNTSKANGHGLKKS